MITWMQRHKKYLIVTIWISTIAFVGAGFVGWGQYSYGDKAGAVAKVGEIEISMGDLQQSYASLYNQYNQMFQGKFDEEKAKSFGLQKQALTQLVNKTLLLNLAKEYDLDITDQEILELIKTQEYFFTNGVFDKETYKQTLSRNNLTMKEYEADIKKQLLLQKLFKLLPVAQKESEKEILKTMFSIADKLNYKILNASDIYVDTSDAQLKPYWEKKQYDFMTEVSYKLAYITQEALEKEYTDEELEKHYNEDKTAFRDNEDKIIPFEEAKEIITQKLKEEDAHRESLRTYIDYKNGKLSEDIQPIETTISASNNPFNEDVLKQISEVTVTSPYIKPIRVNEKYITFKLLQVNPSQAKTFEEAKAEVTPLFIQDKKREKLLELAKNSYETFQGQTTSFLTVKDTNKIADLSETEASEFLSQLFGSNKKRSYVELGTNKVVLYNILEQQLLENNNSSDENIAQLKNALFQEALFKTLEQKYSTEIFIEGL